MLLVAISVSRQVKQLWMKPTKSGGGAKNETPLAPSCHVLIIATKFGEFLSNRFRGDSLLERQTDRQTEQITISPRFFHEAWG